MIFITKFSVHSHTSVEYELKEWPAKFVPELSRLSIRHFELVALTFMPIILSLCYSMGMQFNRIEKLDKYVFAFSTLTL
jgi:hypothetical protein